jgi:hypothetical protein
MKSQLRKHIIIPNREFQTGLVMESGPIYKFGQNLHAKEIHPHPKKSYSSIVCAVKMSTIFYTFILFNRNCM